MTDHDEPVQPPSAGKRARRPEDEPAVPAVPPVPESLLRNQQPVEEQAEVEPPTELPTEPPTELPPEPSPGPTVTEPAAETSVDPVPADEPEPDEGTAPVPAKRSKAGKQKKAKVERSTGRKITYWVGVGMVLAGLGLLAYVAWQLWGTNWVSKKHQREITSQLTEDWSSGQGQSPQFVPKGDASALIRIPRFGSDYVVPVLEGTTPEILAKGFGHFNETGGTGGRTTAFPGQVGNYALAAHRVTHGEPLRRMPDLRPGDKVIVETVDATYTYRLDTNPNDLVIPFTGVWVLDPVPTNPDGGVQPPKQTPGQRLIPLTTCSEIFHTDNRMIAFGHLVDVEKKAAAQPSADAGEGTDETG